MILLSNKTITNVIEYLNDQYPTDREVYMHICEGYDCIDVDNQVGFGVSKVPTSAEENFEIWIAGDLSDECLITTIAHEFAHFIQYIHGEPFDEDEAEEFANKVLEDLQCKKQ